MPPMTRLVRRIAAFLAVAALAFAQLATSAHACLSGMEGRAHVAGDSAAGDCAKVANPNLCERHCDNGSSSVSTSSAASFAADVAPLSWGMVPLVATRTSSVAIGRPAAPRADIPPLTLFGALRI